MSEPYRFLNTNVHDAAMNMAIDESILTHHLKGEVPPTLRVFRWSQPSISLGRFQSIEREIVSGQCLERGVALVRRPTGGRAVYHRDEFTYSIVISKRFGVPSGIIAAYAYLAQGLLAALTCLGVQAELSDGRVSKNPSAACFASSSDMENGVTASSSAKGCRGYSSTPIAFLRLAQATSTPLRAKMRFACAR